MKDFFIERIKNKEPTPKLSRLVKLNMDGNCKQDFAKSHPR